MSYSLTLFVPSLLFIPAAVHCNLSQNGMDHQMCPDDVTSHLEEEPLDQGAMLDDDSPTYQDVSPGYQRHPPPQRSLSESELSRVRTGGLKCSLS